MAIVAHIHGFFTVGGGFSCFVVRRWRGLGLRREDWSSPAFSIEGIVVVTTVSEVGGGGGRTVGDGLGVTAFGAAGALASLSQASMIQRTVGASGLLLVHRGEPCPNR